ncbi:MAG TPA: UDP-3-O-(3-hydroxymyristoyl)glucosamine N-acyltransferase [Terriglobia bacterium]|nr:UDP-3-O-(3-hydroxymyristoyl)glucosamine N-acyltransferase [Terriglobia bacterium]
MKYTVAQLAQLLDRSFQGDGTRQILKISSWDSADSTSLVFLEVRHKGNIPPEGPKAAAIIAPAGVAAPTWTVIVSEKPKLDFAKAAQLLYPIQEGRGVRHSSAVIATDATLGAGVDIGPQVTIGARAQVGEGCILQAGVTVGDDCTLGRNCILYPRVVLYPGVVLGDCVVLHSGAVLGSDGFGYVFDGERQVKFPQVGGVVIEDDVEIGANTTIDRGSLGVTRIGRGTKIDNLVQIAHNVKIGQHVVIAAQTGISGSTIIEDYAVIGGQVGFGDHARVEKGAVIGSKAGVLPGKIVRSGDVYWGVPVRPLREYKLLNALFGRLPEMKADIDALKQRANLLERHEKDSEPPIHGLND